MPQNLPEVDSIKLFGILVLGAAFGAVLIYVWDRIYQATLQRTGV